MSDVNTDTGVILEALNDKVDLDGHNLSTQGKSLISGLGMPSSRYDNLTLGASGTEYTEPANGYFMLYAQYNSGANTAFDIYSTDGTALGGRHWFGTNDVNGAGRVTVPARKNQTFTVTINGTLQNIDFKFIYAEGEPNV